MTRSATFHLRFLNFVVGTILIDAVICADTYHNAETITQARSKGGLVDRILFDISAGKFSTDNDTRLIDLVRQDISNARRRHQDPATGIEFAARKAQEAVSEVTIAYTAAIFRSPSISEAHRIFARFKNTVDRIVEFARNGYVVR